MTAWPVVPGVSAAGHITPHGGFWHPGQVDGCPKCPDPEMAPSVPRPRRGNVAPAAKNDPGKGRRA